MTVDETGVGETVVDETGVDELGINHWWQPSMEHLCSCSDSTNMHRTC